jgi:hypothetical protein
MNYAMRVLCIAALLGVLVYAQPPVPPESKNLGICYEVKNVTFNTATKQCGMDVRKTKNDHIFFISSSTIDDLSVQAGCDFFPYLASTTLCSELLGVMRGGGAVP